jgi:pimeloyl-ACP methyl ester carboxylesterase
MWRNPACGPHKCLVEGTYSGTVRYPTRMRMRSKAEGARVCQSSKPERRGMGGPPIRNLMRPFTTNARIVSHALVLWVALAFGMTVAEAASPVRVFAIRGVGGALFSRGMNILCDELAELVSVTCTVEDFTEVTSIESQARAADAAGAHVVLVGHSMGADAAIEIANEIAGPVALVAAIDPSRFAARPVPGNVAVVLNYYERTDIYGRFFGRGVVSTAEGFNGRITRVELDEPHVVIDRDPEIHAAIIAEITNLLQ